MNLITRATTCALLLIAGGDVLHAQSADTLTITSRALGQERTVFISAPTSHAQTRRVYPVVIVLDGEYNFADARTITSKLASLGHFPEAIVVGISNAGTDPNARVYDMTPPGMSVSGSSRDQGGERFLDFIEKELLPRVSEKYRGGAPNMLVGHSSGGVIATYAAATRPAVFPVVVSIDAPVHLDQQFLVSRMMDSSRSPAPQPIRYVSLETRLGWSDSSWNALRAAAPTSWKLYRAKLGGESHESMGFLAMYEGLKHAFADFSIMGAPLVPRASATTAFEHYRAIEKEFNAQLPPPARVLNQLVEDLLTEAKVEPARRAYAWLVEGYGPQRNQQELEQMIARIAALPPLKETVEQLAATPLPSPQDISRYIGLWKGEGWLNEHTRWPMTLRIAVKDGKVIAETEGWGPPGEFREIDYLKVVPGGIEFGNMNGMRPKGMIVNSGKLNGATLEGEGQFRGIVLPLPRGHMPPVTKFRLVKAE